MQSFRRHLLSVRFLSTTTKRHPGVPPSTPQYGEWNDAWETAWLPEDLSANNRAPWETDVNFPADESPVVLSSEADPDTKAFVEEMDERWDERRKRQNTKKSENRDGDGDGDYRLRKQRIHASLWMKEIEKNEESRLGVGNADAPSGDIDVLLDSCTEIFDCNTNTETASGTSPSEVKNKPDGWETFSSKPGDGGKNVWEVTQREEDILLQEFERRIAFSKFQIASFIKTHIFSRRRPIDGWKYMIEELGPNARKGKGSAQRMPSFSDPSTQPFKQDNNRR